ncbi:ferredoxin [soil metagenome]
MASPNRLPDNVPGAYYVTDECIDCTKCYENFPAFFRLNRATSYSEVRRQPTTPKEIAFAEEALDDCPVEAIQRDGLTG